MRVTHAALEVDRAAPGAPAGPASDAGRSGVQEEHPRCRVHVLPLPGADPCPQLPVGEGGVDRILVGRAQAGDRRAFDLLAERYYGRVVRLVSQYVRDSADALDLAQETFFKAYRSLHTFRGESSFYTWLYRIAINVSNNHLAARRRAPDRVASTIARDGEEYTREPEELATPERQLALEQVEETVAGAFRDLPEPLKTAIVLREIECMSYEEIAKATECPVGTVRSRLFRAREFINRRLEPVLD